MKIQKMKLALALTLILALALAACGGNAETPASSQTDNGNGEAQSNGIEAAVAIGDIIQFGEYEWRVLDVQDSNAFLLSDSLLEQRPYHANGGDITWEHSSLRAYLNSEFYNNFSEAERELIIETTVINHDHPQGTPGGNDTVDRIFLLSIDEAEQNLPELSRISGQGLWWLRTPGRNSNSAAMLLSGADVVDEFTRSYTYSGNPVQTSSGDCQVRPAMWIVLDLEYITVIASPGAASLGETTDGTLSSGRGGETGTITGTSPPPIGVNTGSASITLGKSTYAPGESISITLTEVPQEMVNAGGWTGIFRIGASHDAWGDLNLWDYIPSANTSNITLTAPSDAGNYEIRLFSDGGTSNAAFVMSVSFSVVN